MAERRHRDRPPLGALCHLGNIVTRRPHVRFDPKAEAIIGDEEANRLVRRNYRDGHWAVPKGV